MVLQIFTLIKSFYKVYYKILWNPIKIAVVVSQDGLLLVILVSGLSLIVRVSFASFVIDVNMNVLAI